MTEEELMQLITKQVKREVKRQFAPVVTEILQVLKSLQKTNDQRRQQHRQTLLWELEDLRRLGDLDDPAALPDKP